MAWIWRKLNTIVGVVGFSISVLVILTFYQDGGEDVFITPRSTMEMNLKMAYRKIETKDVTPSAMDELTTATTQVKTTSTDELPTTISKLASYSESPSVSYSNKYHVLTMLSLFHGNASRGYENFTSDELRGRDGEYLETLRRNLNHDQVVAVHLFYINDDDLKVIDDYMFKCANKQKITLVKWHRKIHMADFFLYASRYLVDKSVIAMNSDIVLGEGFDRINTLRLRDERVMFSLTRYAIHTKNKTCNTEEMTLDMPYRASHDTHIFRLAEPLNETLILDKLDYPINMWGAENAMIWTFRYLLKFIVRNPCKVLFTYHKHCSKVHGPNLRDIRKHKYSIFHMGWTRKQSKAGKAPYENTLTYRT